MEEQRVCVDGQSPPFRDFVWQFHFVCGFSSAVKMSLLPPFKVAFYVGELLEKMLGYCDQAFD